MLLLFFSSYGYSYSQVNTPRRIYVASVNFNILTAIEITCTDFETNFNGRMQLKVIDNQDTVKMLDLFLNKVKYARKSRDIDVRAKFIYEKEDGEKVRICANKFDILIGGRLIKTNKKFVDFLRNLAM